MVFEWREVRKRKGCDRTTCPFCLLIAFDRSVGSYVGKVCQLTHLGRVVNLFSTFGHVKCESDLSIEERTQLVDFRNIAYTDLQSKNGFYRLFSNLVYDSDIYIVSLSKLEIYCTAIQKRICLDCKWYLNLNISGHRVSSKKLPSLL